MLLRPQINQCSNCKSLKELLAEIECSIYNLAHNKANNEKFNTSLYFSIEHFKSLTQYKRIITTRVFNPQYTSIATQDIITQANKLIYGNTECSQCFQCTD